MRNFGCSRFAALALACCSPCISAAISTQRATEAEAVSGGTVIGDNDASGLQAVTRTTEGIYTWWVLPSGNVPTGDYTAFVRARSVDGKPHEFTDLAYADDAQVGTLSASVGSKAYRWYRLGEFSFAGSVLRLSDWSDASLAIDRVILEPVTTANAKDVSGGSLVADPASVSGTAVTRATDGIYTWWQPTATGLAHGSYSVYIRARTQGSSTLNFTDFVYVNGSQVAMLSTPVAGTAYQWINLGSFDYLGSNLRIADYSNAGLVIDQVRLVQNKPLDATLGLYHLWYGNANLGGTLSAEAESLTGGTAINDIAASNGQAATLNATGIYLWWSVPTNSLVAGAQYTVDVRMKSLDGNSHNFGLIAQSGGTQLAQQNTGVSSTSYQWYKALPAITYKNNDLLLSDWSEPGLAVDEIRIQLLSPQSTGYQQVSYYAQGAPGTPGISTSPGRMTVLPQANGQVYGYFRQTMSSSSLNEYVGVSSDGGISFEVQPQPIISLSPNPSVPGFGSLSTAYDASPFQTPTGYYLVFEGAGAHPFSSLLAYSSDGLHNWVVQGGLVTSPSYTSSASTPNVMQDAESSALYLQWVDVDSAAGKTSRHQANLSYLQSWNSQATWPSAAALWSDPTIGALAQSPANTWDAANYGAGGVINEDGYYYMVFEGAETYICSATAPGTWGIGLARNAQATLADPAQWIKSPLNPLMKQIQPGDCWIGYPQLAKIGGEYYLYYSDSEANYTTSGTNSIYRRAIVFPTN